MAQRCLCPNLILKDEILLTFWLFLGWLITGSISAQANPLSLQQLYINPEHQTLPEALIIYNSANPCENCQLATDMLIKILQKNYRHVLHAYLINLNDHPQFAYAFKIDSPLTLVMIHISDGASFGYQKLTDLESYVYTPQIFDRRVNEFIANFL